MCLENKSTTFNEARTSRKLKDNTLMVVVVVVVVDLEGKPFNGMYTKFPQDPFDYGGPRTTASR